tara:strand:- start:440 stop:586 length:147 start_codon:yes stop_codon:yes gene_type:complete
MSSTDKDRCSGERMAVMPVESDVDEIVLQNPGYEDSQGKRMVEQEQTQ